MERIELEEFDHVELVTGERGAIVEIYNDGEAYEFEQIPPPKNKFALWTISPSDIARKLESGK